MQGSTQLQLAFLDTAAPCAAERAEPSAEVDPLSYDTVVVAFSGGKDSLACLLLVLEQGVEPARIEVHHHDIDGRGVRFMDWPCTEGYVRKVCEALGVRLLLSWRQGGFLREMERDGQSAPIEWERPDGTVVSMASDRSKHSRRFQYPAKSADLKVRYCSPSLKIDPMRRILNNEDRFQERRTLVVTGERGQESSNRARYADFEPHHSDNRNGRSRPRTIDAWRPIHAWSEAEVWEIIRRWRINPHPAYRLGFSRLSCRQCIFSSHDQWATIRLVYPNAFAPLRQREVTYGKKLDAKLTLDEMADRGTPYAASVGNPDLARLADLENWDEPVFLDDWTMPPGAFGCSGGPS